MGEVYRARDTRLGRDVALKVLPREFTADPDRLARFEREARALAALNHPHIAAIYGIEDIEPADRTAGYRARAGAGARRGRHAGAANPAVRSAPALGGLSTDDALAIARQIADALDVAHEKGIVHRDLKPVEHHDHARRCGESARLRTRQADAAVERADPALTSAPTLTADGTRDGLILGTAAYMSPEQARGQTVDKRTDIWAFGCVLYEMLAGRVAFARATATDTLAAILEREPDWTALPPDLPRDSPALAQPLPSERSSAPSCGTWVTSRIGLEEVITVPVVTGHAEADRVAQHRRRLAIGLALVARHWSRCADYGS